ncbi:MAG: hypothetical protein FD123_475 [Bacteroidetes bacterium]|nr:MAG: hypothetical protein FD123_475 [Bacteroidota bacterium]
MKHPSFLLLLLFHFSCLPAQKIPGKIKTYTVHLSCSDYTAKATVLNTPAVSKAKPELTYYWYAANKVNQTQGGFDGKLLDGIYTAHYLDNNLKEKGKFVKGLKQGAWINWHANGKIREQVKYRDGRNHGEYRAYDENGRLVKREFFRKGLLHGKSETYMNDSLKTTTYYKEGKAYEPKSKRKSSAGKTETEPAGKNEKKKGKLPALFKKKGKPAATDDKPAEEKTLPQEKTKPQKKKPKEKKPNDKPAAPVTSSGK